MFDGKAVGTIDSIEKQSNCKLWCFTKVSLEALEFVEAGKNRLKSLRGTEAIVLLIRIQVEQQCGFVPPVTNS
jgi:hypothetical protein